jgi:hypothetical protein
MNRLARKKATKNARLNSRAFRTAPGILAADFTTFNTQPAELRAN